MKPYVICHMLTSVDRRILPDQWHPAFDDHGIYEKLHAELEGDAWLVGRVTGQEFAERDAPMEGVQKERLNGKTGSHESRPTPRL